MLCGTAVLNTAAFSGGSAGAHRWMPSRCMHSAREADGCHCAVLEERSAGLR